MNDSYKSILKNIDEIHKKRSNLNKIEDKLQKRILKL